MRPFRRMSREFVLPGTRARWAPDRPVDVEHYRIAVAIHPDEHRISGETTVRATVLARELRRLELDAVELEVTAVTEGAQARGFTHDGRTLSIDLGAVRKPGQPLEVTITYSARPRRGLYFVGPDAGYPDKPRQVWTQGQDEDSRYWFPCFDSPHAKATSEVIADVPAGWYALSNGVLLEDKPAGDRRHMHWRHDQPHSCYLVTLAAGELATIEDHWRDIPIVYHVPHGREAQARRTLGRTPQMMELFSKLFGVPYPYQRYAQVCVHDFIFGGMENTTATTLTETILLDERAAIDDDEEALVAHELAHQWFGDLITCRDWGEGWLNEGFATYSEYLWREHADGRDEADLMLDEFLEMYFHEDGARYRRTICTKHYDEPIDVFDHHLYDKAGRVLHMLRMQLGDELFWKSLRHYLTKHRHGVVETRDLARAIEDATGKVLDDFFSQWILDGAGHPELKVSMEWDAETRLAEVVVEQTQKVEGRTPLFRMPATLRFRVGAKDVDVPVQIQDARHAFHVPLADAPTQMIFDPGRGLLAAVETHKSQALWAGELAGATLAIDRAYAARALGKKGGPKAAAALDAALAGDPFWAVRGAAATALGVMRGDAARDRLVSALSSEKHARARRAIVRALGEFRGSVTAAEVLAGLVEQGDASYFVEAEACLSLGKVRAPQAPALLRQAATRDAFLDVIRSHAYKGLAEARDDSAIDFLLDATAWGRVSHGRRAAIGALAVLCKGRKDREAARVRERIEELLEDRDFRVQSSALEGLAVLGDAAAVAAIERMAERELDGRLRRRSREVVRDLSEKASSADELIKLRDEVADLKSTTSALRDRLDKLEARGSAKQAEKEARKAEKEARRSKKKKP
jgi:aminopeptidase N